VNTRHEFDGLFSLYDGILLFWLAVVVVVTLFALLRYTRRRPGQVSKRSKANVAEVLYALVIAGFVSVLVYFTFTTEDRVDRVAADPGLAIRVTAFQWGWRFTYPGGKSVVGDQNHPPVAAVPVGRTVRFTGTSRDVVHDFDVPDLRFKADLNPDDLHVWDLVFPRAGSYDGQCSEFCGLHHTDMTFRIVAMSSDRFRSWLGGGGA
jgi:cytochrome c oxidase subunit 2